MINVGSIQFWCATKIYCHWHWQNRNVCRQATTGLEISIFTESNGFISKKLVFHILFSWRLCDMCVLFKYDSKRTPIGKLLENHRNDVVMIMFNFCSHLDWQIEWFTLGNWIHLPFSMWTRTDIGLALDGAHVYLDIYKNKQIIWA